MDLSEQIGPSNMQDQKDSRTTVLMINDVSTITAARIERYNRKPPRTTLLKVEAIHSRAFLQPPLMGLPIVGSGPQN